MNDSRCSQVRSFSVHPDSTQMIGRMVDRRQSDMSDEKILYTVPFGTFDLSEISPFDRCMASFLILHQAIRSCDGSDAIYGKQSRPECVQVLHFSSIAVSFLTSEYAYLHI